MEAAVALAPAPRAIAIQSDADLVAAVRRGDDRAFEELYGRYNRRISSYIFGMVKDHARAEDLTQDVFVSALRRMRDTDRPIAFKPWIYEIAKNACIDQFRRARRAEEVSYDAEEGLGAADYGRLVTGDPTPDVALDHKQQLDHLRGALGGLSEAHHQILVMREFEGLSYREIGERMNMSRPSVESTLFRARKRLTEEYEELVTGNRCVRIQAIITSAGGGGLGARDRRRMARHLSYCQPCRRHARAAGLGEVVPERVTLAGKIAALLPLPAFLRRRIVARADDGTVGAGVGHGGTIAQWSANLGPMADSAASGWTKAIATAATVAVAGVGAGAMTATSHSPRALSPASLASVTQGSRGARAAAKAVSTAPVAGATTALPARSPAGEPTALASAGKGAGTTASGAGSAGAAGGAAGDVGAARGANQAQGSAQDDPLGSVTRGVLPSGNDGKNGDGHGQNGGSDDDDPTGSSSHHGPQLPSSSIGSPSGAGLPDAGSAVQGASSTAGSNAKDAAPAAGSVIDAATQVVDALASAGQATVGTANATLGQLGGG